MRYWLYRIVAFFVGFSFVLKRLKSSGHYDLAFEIATVRANSLYSRSATFQYTERCAEDCIERAELAFSAQAYEHSWANASDAKLILEWNESADSGLAQKAHEIIAASAKEIDTYRIEELNEKYSDVRDRFASEHRVRRSHENSLFGTARIAGYRLRVKKWRRTHISERPF